MAHNKENTEHFNDFRISIPVHRLASGSSMAHTAVLQSCLHGAFLYHFRHQMCGFFLQNQILVFFFMPVPQFSDLTLCSVIQFNSATNCWSSAHSTGSGLRPSRLPPPPLEMPAANGVPKLPTLLPADYHFKGFYDSALMLHNSQE